MTVSGRKELVRTLSLEEYEESLKKAKDEYLKTLHVHLRRASSGRIIKESVHLWRHKDIVMSHNGYIGKYLGSSSPKSDSYQLFLKNEGGALQCLKREVAT
ncbi:MAG: hypothetical protein QXV05_06180 [Candidatus Korarchaeum sp.]